MASITRIAALMVLVFSLACGGPIEPETNAAPAAGDSVSPTTIREAADRPAPASPGQPDDGKGTDAQTRARPGTETREHESQTTIPATTSGRDSASATRPPASTVKDDKAQTPPGTVDSSIGPISNEQATQELRRAGISPSGWDTNFTLRSVDYGDIMGGGPGKDGIPSIDTPIFQTVAEADEWLDDREPVQVVDIDGDARAYPMQVMMWHEIVNDIVGGEPVVVTY